MYFVDKSITGTYFFEQLATLRVVPTALLQVTDQLEWSCDRPVSNEPVSNESLKFDEYRGYPCFGLAAILWEYYTVFRSFRRVAPRTSCT